LAYVPAGFLDDARFRGSRGMVDIVHVERDVCSEIGVADL
jgi:hypothetical protein